MTPREIPTPPGCALGRQMTIEFYDCDAKILADAPRMEEIFVTSAKESGATVISSHFHSFMPQGVSGVVHGRAMGSR